MIKAFGEKYELDVMPIGIGGKRLELYGVSNWDTFVERLDREGEAYIKNFPFWVKIWEASIVLTDHLTSTNIGKNKNVLEIGAGMGITGLFLSAMGHNVTITDYEESALTLLELNVEHNELENIRIEKLDWDNPDLTGTYDIICGSELIYKKAHIKPLLTLFKTFLSPEGAVFLAHDIGRQCLVPFTEMTSRLFEIQTVVKSMKWAEEIHKIVIHTLRLRQPSHHKHPSLTS
jgi:predicted nicotinamide N-methyase